MAVFQIRHLCPILDKTKAWNMSQSQWWLWNQCSDTTLALYEYLSAQKWMYWFFAPEDGAKWGISGTRWTLGNHHVLGVYPMPGSGNKGEPFIIDATTYWWKGETKADVKTQTLQSWRKDRPIELNGRWW